MAIMDCSIAKWVRHVLVIIPALAGMWIGTMIRKRISAKAFRRGFLSCLTLLGLELIIRPLL